MLDPVPGGGNQESADGGHVTIRVAVIGDHLLVTQAVSAAHMQHPNIEVVATNPKADFWQRAGEIRPDVAILDASVQASDLDPVVAVEILRRVWPEVEFLVLIRRGDWHVSRDLIEAGARGCLLGNDEQILYLGAVVSRVSRGERTYSPEVVQQYFDFVKFTLTQRQLTVLRLAAEGLSNSAIARRLRLANSTIRNCLSAIYAKLNVSRGAGLNPRVGAINRARRAGLLRGQMR